MKARLSDKMREILADPDARNALSEGLARTLDKPGSVRVEVNGKVYDVQFATPRPQPIIRRPFQHLTRPTRPAPTVCPRCERPGVLRFTLTHEGELVEPRCRECCRKEGSDAA